MPKASTTLRRRPQRTCVACRRVADKAELVRVVRSAEGDVLLDSARRSSGRGAYLCRAEACWAKGISTGKVGRALRMELEPESGKALLRELAGFAEKEVSS